VEGGHRELALAEVAHEAAPLAWAFHYPCLPSDGDLELLLVSGAAQHVLSEHLQVIGCPSREQQPAACESEVRCHEGCRPVGCDVTEGISPPRHRDTEKTGILHVRITKASPSACKDDFLRVSVDSAVRVLFSH
jgi:hypothetical protein